MMFLNKKHNSFPLLNLLPLSSMSTDEMATDRMATDRMATDRMATDSGNG